jgi:hypothetical protein
MMVNLRCHLGSSSYELDEGIGEAGWAEIRNVLVYLELSRDYWSARV